MERKRWKHCDAAISKSRFMRSGLNCGKLCIRSADDAFPYSTPHSSDFFGWFRLMVFNATFKNISVISWRTFLLVEETGVLCRPTASNWQTLSHAVVSSTLRNERCSNTQLCGDRHWYDHDHNGPHFYGNKQ